MKNIIKDATIYFDNVLKDYFDLNRNPFLSNLAYKENNRLKNEIYYQIIALKSLQEIISKVNSEKNPQKEYSKIIKNSINEDFFYIKYKNTKIYSNNISGAYKVATKNFGYQLSEVVKCCYPLFFYWHSKMILKNPSMKQLFSIFINTDRFFSSIKNLETTKREYDYFLEYYLKDDEDLNKIEEDLNRKKEKIKNYEFLYQLQTDLNIKLQKLLKIQSYIENNINSTKMEIKNKISYANNFATLKNFKLNLNESSIYWQDLAYTKTREDAKKIVKAGISNKLINKFFNFKQNIKNESFKFSLVGNIDKEIFIFKNKVDLMFIPKNMLTIKTMKDLK